MSASPIETWDFFDFLTTPLRSTTNSLNYSTLKRADHAPSPTNQTFICTLGINKLILKTRNQTRLSYYNVTTRFVDLVGLCYLKQNVVAIYAGYGFNC